MRTTRPARDGAARSLTAFAVAACLAIPHEASAAAAAFTGLGDLPGSVLESVAYGVSADGSVVVGYGFSAGGVIEAFRWTEADGMQGLGALPGVVGSIARGVSADGSVIVGESGGEAFRWTAVGGMQGLGSLVGASQPGSAAYDVSADGSVVIGWSRYASNVGQRAFRWTTTGGMVALLDDTLPNASIARAVSADGSTIVGDTQTFIVVPERRFQDEAFRWTAGDGLEALGFLPGSTDADSHGYDVSADGSVVAGYGSLGPAPAAFEAFRWTAADGMTSLGRVTGGAQTFGYGVSDDGSVVVGGSFAEGGLAFVWDEAHGVRALYDLLYAAGAPVRGWRLDSAWAVSADGRTIVGQGLDPDGHTEAWRAVLPEPVIGECNDGIDNDGDGLVDLADPGCPFPESTPENPQCDDGIDNNGDGLVDFDDPNCQPSWPYWEKAPCGIGIELVALIPAIRLLHSRRRRSS